MTSGEPTAISSNRGTTALLALALVAAVFAAFAPALTAHFVNWDDPANLEDLRAHGGELGHFWYATGKVDPYQPLSWWSLMLDQRMWGLSAGLEAPQAGRFHASSIALHALTAVAFFFLARRLLALAVAGTSERARNVAAAFAACLFAVHPLRVESVAWFSERRDVLSGLFFVVAASAWLRGVPTGPARIVSKRAAIGCFAAAALALIAFFTSVEIHGRDPVRWSALGPFGLAGAALALGASVACAARATGRSSTLALWFAVAVACFFAALFSKALTVVLPLLLCLLDVWPLKRVSRASLFALFVEKVPLFALAIVVAALATWAQVRTASDTLINWQAHTLTERIAQACYGLAFYPSRTLAPHGLIPIYELPDDIRFSDPRFAVSALAVLVAAVALLALRKRWPGALAASAAFALAILPVLGFTQAGPQIVADRYSYLSCMPFAVLAGGAWLAAFERSPRARIPAAILALAVVITLGVLTHAQTATWHDSETMWTRAVAIEPDNTLANSMLAAVRTEQAEAATDPQARHQLLLEVDRLYRHALALDDSPIPGRLLAFGTNLLRLERPQEALDPIASYLTLRPDDAAAHTNYGLALRLVGRTSEGLEHLQRSVAIDPDNAKNWTQLALALEATGDKSGAIAAYEQVARLWPNHEPTRRKLAQLRGG